MRIFHLIHMVLCLLSSIIVSETMANHCPDTLYERLLTTPIIKMTDGEYRYFRKYQDECFDYNPCVDSQLVWLEDKLINEMNQNESDYFLDRFLDCGKVCPCSTKQFLYIKDKNQFDMLHEELDFYKNSLDKCYDYKVNRKLLRKRKIIFISILGSALLLIVGAIPAYHIGK